ncbi:peptidylprolyl isomerase [Candidatus Woesearchaeota archaeon]|nr:peptidylprolyl isomerase [Candidatus Woesearchaeota archaeon]
MKNIFDKAKEFYKNNKDIFKYSGLVLTILLLIVPIVFSVYYRSLSITLPIADDWAESNVVNYMKNQIATSVSAQFPNLPDARKSELVEEQYNMYVKQNSAQLQQQIQENADYLRGRFQDPNGTTYLLAIDPYFYYRQARNIVEKGTIYDDVVNGVPTDNHMLYPLGRASTTFDFHSYVIYWFYSILNVFGTFSLVYAAFLIPMIIATLGIIPAFFIAKKIGGKIAGFFAGLLFAVHSALLTRTTAGFSDTDGYNVTFPLFIVWFVLESLYAKTTKMRFIFAGLAAVFTGIFATAWSGWWYSFDIVIATIVLYLIIVLAKEFKKEKKFKLGKDSLEIVLSGGLYFILSGILVTILRGFATFKGFVVGPLSFLFLKDVGGTKIWPNVFTTVAELNEATIPAIIESMYGKVFFLIAMMGIVLSIVAIKGKVSFFKKLASTVSGEEKRRHSIYNMFVLGSLLWYAFVIFALTGISQTVFLLLLAIPLIIVFVLDVMYELKIDARYALLLTIWFIATMYASTKGIRFTLVLVPAFSVAFGLAVAFLIKSIAIFSDKELGVAKKIAIPVLFVMALFLLKTPISTADSISIHEIPSMSDGWYESLKNIDENASEFAVVNSWWDFGHWFKAIADRPVTFDGASQNTPQAHWIGNVLLTDSEDRAIGTLRMLDCGANTAFDNLLKVVVDQLDTKLMIDDLIMIENRSDAEDYLKENVPSITSAQIKSVVDFTHCTKLPENYFITSDDMVGKSGVWAHFGIWNFTKSTIVNIVKNNPTKAAAISKLETRFGYNKTTAEDYYYQVMGNDPNQWIASWPSYMNGAQTCTITGDLVYCKNGVGMNLTTGEAFVTTQQGNKHPQSISYVQGGEFVLQEYDNNTIPYSAAFYTQGNTLYSILMFPELAGSMFTRLYFFNGIGLKHFNKFSDKQLITGGRVIVWKVDWDGNPDNNNLNEEEKMSDNPVVVIETNKGDIEVELYQDKAPITVENFLSYMKDGFYSDTIFHRVIKGFMIQGGGFDLDYVQKETKDPIKLESDNGLDNNRGTIAMARTTVPNSATSQFFINTVDNDFLNKESSSDGYGYTVFGKVVLGMDVVDSIESVKTSVGPIPGAKDWPVDDVIIKKVYLKE